MAQGTRSSWYGDFFSDKSSGFVKHHGKKDFSVTKSGAMLKKSHPSKLYSIVLFERDVTLQKVWNGENVERMLRQKESTTPVSSFATTMGMNAFQFIFSKPEMTRLFQECMTGFMNVSKIGLTKLIPQIDWKNVTSVCDIGGGNGMFLSLVLNHVKGNCKGVVYELKKVVDDTANHYKHSAISWMEGDMFTNKPNPIPKGQDVYAVKSVLCNWSEDEILKLLKNVLDAAKVGSRIMIVGIIVPEVVEKGWSGAFNDLHMMTVVNGRERAESEYKKLLGKAGWGYDKCMLMKDPLRNGIVIGVKK